VQPPAGFGARRPTVDDIDDIRRLTQACDVAVLGFSDWSADEVREQLESPRGPAATHHWIVTGGDGNDPGEVVGWATASDQSGGAVDVDWYVQPALARNPYFTVTGWLVHALLTDIEDRGRAAGATSVRLETGAYRQHTERAAELLALGYRHERTFFRMARPVDPDETFAPPAAGIVLVPGGDTEDQRRVMHRILDTAFADHFNHHDRDFDEWWTDQRGHAGVDLTHWRIAELDGVPVGACTVTDRYLDQNDGYIGSLGVLRAGRGRGVAKALLANAFAFYRDAGRSRVLLHVDADSPTGATRLYESVGMTQDLALDFFAVDHRVPAEADDTEL
jgi:mycothiol synthase